LKTFKQSNLSNHRLVTKNEYILGIFAFAFLSATATGDTISIYKFLTYGVANDIFDPWSAAYLVDNTWASGNGGPFRYPFAMYLILLPGRLITWLFGFESEWYSPLGALGINATLTVAFIVSYKVQRYFVEKFGSSRSDLTTKILIALNPAVLLSLFIGRQLDILPIATTLLCLYFVLKEKYFIGGLALGVAIAMKSFPAFILLPIVLWIVGSEINFIARSRKIALFVIPSLMFPLSGLMIFNSSGYTKMVLENSDQFRLFWFSIFFAGTWFPLYVLPVIFTMMLALQYYFQKNWEKIDLLGFIGAVLMLPTTFAPPFVIWWSWAAPFIMVFLLSKNQAKSRRIIHILIVQGLIQVTYALYNKWSYLTQLFSWKKPNFPLTKSPQVIVSERIGETNAETLLNLIFSIQWALSLVILTYIFIKIIRVDLANRSSRS
jgi:hypothetical protein